MIPPVVVWPERTVCGLSRRRVPTATAPVDARAGFAGPEFHVSGVGAIGEDYDPVTVWNATEEEYLVIWLDARKSATRDTDVYGQYREASGARVGRDFRVAGAQAVEEDYWAGVAGNDADNQFLVVWSDVHDPVRDDDVYGRMLNP